MPRDVLVHIACQIVPHKPARAGIDPHNLLIDWETGDSIKTVKVKS